MNVDSSCPLRTGTAAVGSWLAQAVSGSIAMLPSNLLIDGGLLASDEVDF